MKLMRLEVELTDKGKELINEAIKTDGAVAVKKVVDEEFENEGIPDVSSARITNIDANNITANATSLHAYTNRCIEEMNQKIDDRIMSLTNTIKLLESKIEEQNQS